MTDCASGRLSSNSLWSRQQHARRRDRAPDLAVSSTSGVSEGPLSERSEEPVAETISEGHSQAHAARRFTPRPATAFRCKACVLLQCRSPWGDASEAPPSLYASVGRGTWASGLPRRASRDRGPGGGASGTLARRFRAAPATAAGDRQMLLPSPLASAKKTKGRRLNVGASSVTRRPHMHEARILSVFATVMPARTAMNVAMRTCCSLFTVRQPTNKEAEGSCLCTTLALCMRARCSRWRRSTFGLLIVRMPC